MFFEYEDEDDDEDDSSDRADAPPQTFFSGIRFSAHGVDAQAGPSAPATRSAKGRGMGSRRQACQRFLIPPRPQGRGGGERGADRVAAEPPLEREPPSNRPRPRRRPRMRPPLPPANGLALHWRADGLGGRSPRPRTRTRSRRAEEFAYVHGYAYSCPSTTRPSTRGSLPPRQPSQESNKS
jgi:hypothetical protein